MLNVGVSKSSYVSGSKSAIRSGRSAERIPTYTKKAAIDTFVGNRPKADANQ